MILLAVGICKLWKIIYYTMLPTWTSITMEIKLIPSIKKKQSDSSFLQWTQFSQGADYFSSLLTVGEAEAQETYVYIYQELINTFCRNLCLQMTIKKPCAFKQGHKHLLVAGWKSPFFFIVNFSNKGDIYLASLWNYCQFGKLIH